MAVTDVFKFKPQIPLYELSRFTTNPPASNLKSIIDNAITISNYYSTEVMFIRIEFNQYPILDPPDNRSDWGNGVLFFQNKTYEHEEICTLILTTFYGCWAGKIYVVDGSVSELEFKIEYSNMCIF